MKSHMLIFFSSGHFSAMTSDNDLALVYILSWEEEGSSCSPCILWKDRVVLNQPYCQISHIIPILIDLFLILDPSGAALHN